MAKRIYRSNTDKKVCGVCGGLAEYFDLDPVIFRLLWICTIFLAGTGVLAYFLAALVIPKKPDIEIVEKVEK